MGSCCLPRTVPTTSFLPVTGLLRISAWGSSHLCESSGALCFFWAFVFWEERSFCGLITLYLRTEPAVLFRGFFSHASSWYVTAGLCYTPLLASHFVSSTQGSQKNCTDTEGNQCQRPQSEANDSFNSAKQIMQLMHRARKLFAQGPVMNCWQSKAENQEYKSTRLDSGHWVCFHYSRVFWIPCTKTSSYSWAEQ